MTTPGGTWDWMVASARLNGYSYYGNNSTRIWYNETRHLWAFYHTGLSKWIVSKELVPSLEVSDGVVLKAVPNFFYDGEVAFSGAKPDGSSPHVLFYCASRTEYVYRTGTSIAEPVSYKDLDGSTNLGDAWYGYSGSLYLGMSANLEPKGTQTGGNLTLTSKWPRWERRSGDSIIGNSVSSAHYIPNHPLGVYEAVDQTADGENEVADVVIGIPAWKDERGNLYERTLDKDANGNFRYGTISYNRAVSAWTPDGAAWPRGSEPSRNSSVEFKDENDETVLTLSFAGLSPGLFTTDRYFAEACVWRW